MALGLLCSTLLRCLVGNMPAWRQSGLLWCEEEARWGEIADFRRVIEIPGQHLLLAEEGVRGIEVLLTTVVLQSRLGLGAKAPPGVGASVRAHGPLRSGPARYHSC